MARYRLSIHITPRRGILDPQGQAVSEALHSLGFPAVQEVRVGRFLVADVDADDPATARTMGAAMCEKLLANPVTEDFAIAAVEPA
jgi:phosphoribosylformylglycinamidine synthase